MTYDSLLELEPATTGPSTVATPALPGGVALLELPAAALRGWLRERGLGHYAIYHGYGFDVDDVEKYLPQIDAEAAWTPLPLLPGGEQSTRLETDDEDERKLQASAGGVLRLAGHDVVLARWHRYAEKGYLTTTELVAARDSSAWGKLHDLVVSLRCRADEPTWEIVRDAYTQETRPRVAVPWAELLLAPQVKARLQAEVTGFFAPAVAEMYRKLNVPHRRGVLMHGPPGNGKTSIIRAIGGSMTDVYAMILRPVEAMNDYHLKAIFRRWRQHAPAVLVLEDLDHLLKDYINLSHFLNLLDGIDAAPASAGLMMIATTNHPDRLDPAINNRPGRFDVVIEIPSPDANLRAEFFASQLSSADEETRAALVAGTAGLSFAHLHEVIRLSGLLAIHDGGAARTAAHLAEAARLVAASHGNARNGFPMAAEAPFGLAQFRRKA